MSFIYLGRIKAKSIQLKDGEETDAYVEGKLSRNILQQARLQAAEMEQELGINQKVFKKTNLEISVSIFLRQSLYIRIMCQIK